MKKLFTFMMMLGIMAIAIVAQGQVTYTATFNGNNLSFESVSTPDGNTYSQVLLSGVIGNTSDAGKPQLPLHTLQLMIPFGKEVTNIVCSNIVTQSFHGLTGAALNEHNGYMQLLVLNDTLYKQHRTVFELTESETAIVDSLATFGVGIAQVMAENILEANGGPTMVNCPQMVLHDDIGDGGRGKFVAEDLNEALGFTVNVSPNPATTWMALDFTLPNKITKASFTLTIMYPRIESMS